MWGDELNRRSWHRRPNIHEHEVHHAIESLQRFATISSRSSMNASSPTSMKFFLAALTLAGSYSVPITMPWSPLARQASRTAAASRHHLRNPAKQALKLVRRWWRSHVPLAAGCFAFADSTSGKNTASTPSSGRKAHTG
jgi:hypothetical protein